MDATVIQTIEGDPVEHTNNDMDVSENETPDDNKKQDEYDLRMFGIYQALPVEGEPDWESGEQLLRLSWLCMILETQLSILSCL